MEKRLVLVNRVCRWYPDTYVPIRLLADAYNNSALPSHHLDYQGHSAQFGILP